MTRPIGFCVQQQNNKVSEEGTDTFFLHGDNFISLILFWDIIRCVVEVVEVVEKAQKDSAVPLNGRSNILVRNYLMMVRLLYIIYILTIPFANCLLLYSLFIL